MKRGTKLTLMLVALVLIAGVFLLVTLLNPQGSEGNGTQFQTVLKLDPEKVTAIGWKYSTEVNFTKTENGWVNAADSAFPTDEAVIEKMLHILSEVGASKTIEDPTDLDQYGLKNPFCTIKVTADGKNYDLALGDQNSFSGLRYFTNGDGNVYLIANEIASYFNFGPEGALKKEQIPDLKALSNLKVQTQDRSYEIAWLTGSELTYTSAYKWFMDGKVLDTELTEEMLDYIYSLEWKECVDYNATDLTKYGLDKPSAVATVTYLNDKTFVLEIGENTDKGAYARIAGSNMVYYVRTALRNALLNTVYNELMPDEVLAMDWDTVTSMEIILGGNTYTLVHEEVPDPNGCATGSYVWKYNDKKVDGDTVGTKLNTMSTSGYATGLTVEQAEELRFVFYRNEGHHSKVELVFYPYNSSTCLVTLDGVPTVLADRSNVTSLITTINKIIAA